VNASVEIPSIAELKEALMTYGPMYVSMNAVPSLQGYTRGVYNVDAPIPPGQPAHYTNHAVLLVGWDDALGAWKFKNSWGTTAHEGGFGYIKYGLSNFGRRASYVIMPSAETCTLQVSPSSHSIGAGGGTTAAFTVDASSETCSWSLFTTTTGVSFTPTPDATGDGSFTATIPANPGTSARTITIEVTPAGNAAGKKTVTVNQAAPVAPACTLVVSPSSRSIGAAGGTTSAFTVDASSETCSWSPSTSTTGVTFTPTPDTTGDGSFTATIPANTATTPRNITIRVTPNGNAAGEKTVTVSQEAAAPTNCSVPDVKGKTESAAKSSLTGIGFTVKVQSQCDANVAKGSVVQQLPSAGASVSCGSEVTITVSTGPCGGTGKPGDFDGNGTVSALEVSKVIDAFLGIVSLSAAEQANLGTSSPNPNALLTAQVIDRFLGIIQ
jgi:hypothetical protein